MIAVLGAAFLLGAPVFHARGERGYDNQDLGWACDISIEPLSFAVTEPGIRARAHGIAVCTLSVSNRSASAHTVKLSAVRAIAYRHDGNTDYQQECTLAPGASALVCFKFLPIVSYVERMTVEIDGKAKGKYILPPFLWPTSNAASHVTLLSPALSQTAIKYREMALFPAETTQSGFRRQQGSSAYVDGGLLLDGTAPVAQWPAQWLAYTPADCIVLTKEDWETAPPDVRDALRCFVQAGGNLLLAGASKADLERYAIPAGFGACDTLSSALPEAWTEGDFYTLAETAKRSVSMWRPILRDKDSFPTDTFFKPPQIVPVYGLLLCIMIFLGPVLLVALAVRNQRIRIYWLAPCIAGAVSAVILVFALFRDGTSPITHAQSVVYLNGKSGTQVQLTVLSIMAPAGVSSPLRFGPSTEPMLAPSSKTLAPGRKTVRNTEDGLALGSGWVPPRTPVTFLLRDAGMQTPRVPMLAPDASAKAFAKVSNPYPVTLRRLLYCDAEGNCFALEQPLAPGATARLPLYPDVSGTMLLIGEDAKDTFYGARPLAPVCDTYLALPPKHLLPPNTYLCEFDGTPFLEHPLRGNVRHTGQTLMLGELP